MIAQGSILELQNIGAHRMFQLAGQTKLRVQKMYIENKIKTIAKQTFLDANERGYVIQVDILSFEQTSNDELSKLFEDLNSIGSKMILKTDKYGCIQEVLNNDEIIANWIQLKPLFRRQHCNKPNVDEFLNAFESVLAEPDQIKLTILNKGIYGILFPGIYNRLPGETYELSKTIYSYFNNIDLPLKIVFETGKTSNPDIKSNLPQKVDHQKDTVEIKTAKFNIVEDEFKRYDFVKAIKTMTDDVRFHVDLHLECKEDYCVDRNGWLLNAGQFLRTEVAGAYMNEMNNSLTQLQ